MISYFQHRQYWVYIYDDSYSGNWWPGGRNTDDQVTEILMISWQLTLLQTLRVCPPCRCLLSIHEIQHGRIITAPPRLQPRRATGACQQGKEGLQGPAAPGAGQRGSERGGWWDTGEQVKKEGAGLRRIGGSAVQSRPRPSWRVPSPPALGLNHQNSAANNNSAASVPTNPTKYKNSGQLSPCCIKQMNTESTKSKNTSPHIYKNWSILSTLSLYVIWIVISNCKLVALIGRGKYDNLYGNGHIHALPNSLPGQLAGSQSLITKFLPAKYQINHHRSQCQYIIIHNFGKIGINYQPQCLPSAQTALIHCNRSDRLTAKYEIKIV